MVVICSVPEIGITRRTVTGWEPDDVTGYCGKEVLTDLHTKCLQDTLDSFLDSLLLVPLRKPAQERFISALMCWHSKPRKALYWQMLRNGLRYPHDWIPTWKLGWEGDIPLPDPTERILRVAKDVDEVLQIQETSPEVVRFVLR